MTQLLAQWSSGDEAALAELLPLVEKELHRLAHHYMRRERATELLALDEALQELARAAPRQGRVVELRYFGGLSVDETAEVLKVHSNTVLNDWREAKAWLYCALNEGQAS